MTALRVGIPVSKTVTEPASAFTSSQIGCERACVSPPKVSPWNRDTEHDRIAIVGQLLGLLPDTRKNSVDQDHTSIFLFADDLFEVKPAQGQSLPLGRPYHGRDFHKEPLTACVTFEIRCSRLRLRQEHDPAPNANQSGRQFQLSEGRFPHPVILVHEPPNEAPQSKMTRLIGALTVKRTPPIAKLLRKPFFFQLPCWHRTWMSPS